MKICFFNSCKVWGGGEKWYYNNIGVLSKNGMDITLFADKNGELYKRTKDNHNVHGVKVSNLSFLNIFKIMYYTYVFKKKSFDIIIINLPSDIKLAGIAAKLAGVKRIIYRRGSSIPIKNSFLNKYLFKNIVTNIIANSEGTKKSINEVANIFPNEKIKVIYNGIKFRENSIEDKKDKSKVIIGTAGRLSVEKGHKYLLEVAELLKNRGITFEVLIAGEGELKKELEEKIKNMNLSNEVKLIGFTNDITVFMRKIDIFVLPSLWEGFGYVIVEAMESYKPVVAFEVGGVSEIVKNKKTGYLVEKKNVEVMAKKIENLIENRDLITSMGIEGRKRAEELFSIEKVTKILEEYLYKMIVTLK